jgi:LysM repeat protein
MGNLEKAGVLVVVALLAVILVVAFLNFPEEGKPPVLGASAPKSMPAPEVKKPPKPEPTNLYAEPEIIRPRNDFDRSSSDAPPRDTLVNVVPPPFTAGIPKKDDTVANPASPSAPPKLDPPPVEEKKAVPSPWPKKVKVQSGESLWAIAVREYGAKVGARMVAAIADANPRVRPEALRAGTELTLPAPPESAVASKGGADEPKVSSKTPAKPAAKEPAPKDPASGTARKLPFVPQ